MLRLHSSSVQVSGAPEAEAGRSAPVVLQAAGTVTQLPHSATGPGEARDCNDSIAPMLQPLTGLLLTEVHACLFWRCLNGRPCRDAGAVRRPGIAVEPGRASIDPVYPSTTGAPAPKAPATAPATGVAQVAPSPQPVAVPQTAGQAAQPPRSTAGAPASETAVVPGWHPSADTAHAQIKPALKSVP